MKLFVIVFVSVIFASCSNNPVEPENPKSDNSTTKQMLKPPPVYVIYVTIHKSGNIYTSTYSDNTEPSLLPGTMQNANFYWYYRELNASPGDAYYLFTPVGGNYPTIGTYTIPSDPGILVLTVVISSGYSYTSNQLAVN